MFEIGVVIQFEAAHRLRGEFGPATRVHGHTYRVEVAVRGPKLREDGTLCDLGAVRQAVSDAVAPLDYHDLDELAPFQDRNSTAETVAHYLFAQIAPHLKAEGVASLAVKVWESPQCWASFEDAIGGA